jgi:subtilisin-like proprotein convertase family protein
MRRLTLVLFPALSIALTGARPLIALAKVSPAEAPRADARVLRALNAGAERVRVVLGVRDGTPSARALRLSPDPAGEPGRRLVRLVAQRRIADEMPPEDLEVRHFYGSFSLLSATVSRAGALVLANRPDVEWVTLDGTKRPLETAAQGAQMLIHSDQANALNITGAGQTIAVLDTGVDYRVTALGGGAFPNAKVVGGTDTADKDGDPMDCEGHGTSVAAVAAGPSGVAPDAKIVAVKVFSSNDANNASCNEEAKDSDILAGVDWVVANRDALGIGVINISLGGALFEDSLDHGYCDMDLPAYAAAFDSALAMGVAVVVASGNDGTSNALSAPACISSALSVGAVYSQSSPSQSWLDDGGGIQCTDAPAVPDQIVCFSNSATTLSMLAPGAFWLVARKGEGVNLFAGTSAASPAVAGTLALLRQTRPGLPPASLVGILRATGTPITDPRNQITTPRLDALAAVSLDSGRLFSFLGTPASIPDGSGSTSASVTVRGFSGGVAGLEVWVEIDHPDPQQLRVTLTGPDGTTVILHDQTGQHEHPINAIYGKTEVPMQSLGAFQGRPPNGVWTLTVADNVRDSPSLQGRIRNFAIVVEPGQPTASIPSNVVGRVLPILAHNQGSKFFQSNLRVFNPSPTPRDFSLYFVPAGQSGAGAARAKVTIGAGQILAFDDVIASEYGFADSYGPITVTTSDTNFLAAGHNYTRNANGTFGMTVPSFPTAQALAFGGGAATANGLIKSAALHSNVGFTEVSGAPVTVQVDVLDENGAVIGSTTMNGLPNSTPIIADIIRVLRLSPISNFRVNFTVKSPAGRIVPFATYVDDVTGDSIYQPASSPSASEEDILLAQAAHVTGANSQFFRTNLYVTNLDAQPVTITVSLIPMVLTGTPAPPRVYTLAPGQTLERIDVLASEFGLADPSAAGLRIHPDRPARLVVSNNTLVQEFGGTTGFAISGETASRSVGLGRTLTAIQLDHTTSTIGSRCNFGFAEVGGADVIVRATARSGATGEVLGFKDYGVPANTLVQTSAADLLGAGISAENFYVQYSVVIGSGRILAYAVVADNSSGDAIYVPGESAVSAANK